MSCHCSHRTIVPVAADIDACSPSLYVSLGPWLTDKESKCIKTVKRSTMWSLKTALGLLPTVSTAAAHGHCCSCSPGEHLLSCTRRRRTWLRYMHWLPSAKAVAVGPVGPNPSLKWQVFLLWWTSPDITSNYTALPCWFPYIAAKRGGGQRKHPWEEQVWRVCSHQVCCHGPCTRHQ